MISIKSFKNLQALRTQKMIREEMQKEDFFEHLLLQITQQFSAAEYQYLVNYVIPRKNQTRSQKRHPLQTNKQVTFENKENNFVYDTFYYETPKADKAKNDKSFKMLNSQRSQMGQRDTKHYFTESIKCVKRSPDFTKTAYSSQSKTKAANSLSNKKTITRKFKQISILDKQTSTPNLTCNFKLNKRSKKAIQENLFSSQHIKRSYNQKFLRSIMKTETFQEDGQQSKYYDFNETSNIRKTHIPSTDFWQKEKEKEQNYRNFIEVKFQSSAKASRLGVRIFTRKF